MKTLLRQAQTEFHQGCFFCGVQNEKGLKLEFSPLRENGGVEAHLKIKKDWEGYSNILHGGMIAGLLDSAMTNCLFLQGVKALTTHLRTKFLSPVYLEGSVRVKASVIREKGRFYFLKAELAQGEALKAVGFGTFIRFFQKKTAV